MTNFLGKRKPISGFIPRNTVHEHGDSTILRNKTFGNSILLLYFMAQVTKTKCHIQFTLHVLIRLPLGVKKIAL